MISEIITKRNLPHWYKPGAVHFVAYRLYGTLPQSVLDELKSRKEHLLNNPRRDLPVKEHRERVHKQLFSAYDKYLDQCRDIDWLRDPRVAAMIRGNLYHHHTTKYYLLAYCIMPNHVHVLLQPVVQAARLNNDEEIAGTQASRLSYGDIDIGERPDAGSPLSSIMHSLKSYTAHEANKIMKRTGTFWQAESYDHWVRDEDELERIVHYIMANPLEAKLVTQPQDWYFSSCYDRFLTDGNPTGWLRWS